MEEVSRILKNEFYLTSNELLIFNHLCKNGSKKFTAEELCKTLRLPRGKIYDMLVALEERGFVKVDYAKPKSYYMDNITECVEKAFSIREKSLIESERQLNAELRMLDKGELAIKLLATEEELYEARKRMLMNAKVFRLSLIRPLFMLEEDSPRRRYREMVVDNVIENKIEGKFIISDERLKDLRKAIASKVYQELMEYDNLDIRISSILPNFDVGGDVMIIKTTHAPAGPHIYLKSRELAKDGAKLFDGIFEKATPLQRYFKND